ncbi:sugar phosphate isomerase/epimerase family protein [Salmonirosea aquatica]|uniref:TIM barrel protein n=1 Tax=Salmonirosea aquatica TaxID=2654236 RepID=A0A7C9F5B7_9BACT|nr:TIM barrel protein [Cytophagaceae bacterium SJW1-29]
MNQLENQPSRRGFLKQATGALIGLTATNTLAQAAIGAEQPAAYSLPLGVCATYDKVDLLKSLGFSFIEESVPAFLLPDGSEVQYEKNLRALRTGQFPIRSYIYFLPGKLKSVGPDVQHEAILERSELVFKRAKETGTKNIVYGSGGSRFIPDGFDRDKAKAQHIDLCRKLAPLAEQYKVALAIEPLNRGETNFINSLAEGVEIIQAVNNPSMRLQCDIYHMLKEDESPDEILKYGQYISHCHIAEKRKRTVPGVDGDDFRPYFRALKKMKYTGGMSLECNWTDFDKEVRQGLAVLKKQLADV